MTTMKFMFSTGEASGELLALPVITALRQQNPQAHFCGMGSQKMKDAGVDLVVDSSAIAVQGFFEILRHLPAAQRAFKAMIKALEDDPPNVLILIDYVEFNMRLGKQAHALGIPVLYFVPPKIWAMRPGRINRIKKFADAVAVLFPFEVSLYEAVGIKTRYVGHPLGRAVQSLPSHDEAKRLLHLDTAPVIGLLPGSRRNELSQNLPLFAQTIPLLHQRYPQHRFVLALAAYGQHSDLVDPWKAEVASFPVQVEVGKTQLVMRAADALVVCSGTATLEAGLIGTPFVLIGRTSWLSYIIFRMFLKIDVIGLVNIILKRRVTEELIQDKAVPEAIVTSVEKLLSPEGRSAMLTDLYELQQHIGQLDTGHLVAEMVLDLASAKGR